MTSAWKRLFCLAVPIVILLGAGLACRIGPSTATTRAGAPVVTLAGPLNGQVLPVGEPVLVNSTSVDLDGIQRVELWVDGSRVRVDNNPNADSPYLVSQTWQSETPGTHAIVVRAFDARGNEGASQPVVVTLEAAVEPTPLLTALAQPSPSPGGEASPAPPPPTGAPTAPAATSTPAPTPTASPAGATAAPVCTPPPCATGEVYFCPGECPGGCGAQCATPTRTATPPSFEPTGIEVHNALKPVWEKPGVKEYVGYAAGEASDDRRYAKQYFERGYLYWWDRPGGRGLIWAVELPQLGARQGARWFGPYEDTWDGGDAYSCQAARASANGPVSGFGKLWCNNPQIAQTIGAARESERGTGESENYGVVQYFQNGVMLYSPLDHEVWVLFDSGGWQRHAR
jgi:hypothetical protein